VNVTAERVDMPVQMIEVLGQLAGEFEDREVKAVILPLTPLWCEQNAERGQRRWSAKAMAEPFVEIVKAKVSKRFVQPVLSGYV
jgi:hypothetical protein